MCFQILLRRGNSIANLTSKHDIQYLVFLSEIRPGETDVREA